MSWVLAQYLLSPAEEKAGRLEGIYQEKVAVNLVLGQYVWVVLQCGGDLQPAAWVGYLPSGRCHLAPLLEVLAVFCWER